MVLSLCCLMWQIVKKEATVLSLTTIFSYILNIRTPILDITQIKNADNKCILIIINDSYVCLKCMSSVLKDFQL